MLNEKPEVPFFTLMFKNLPWHEMFTFDGLIRLIENVKTRYDLYESIISDDYYANDDMLEEDFNMNYDLDDELYDFVYYKSWTETIPMVLTYLMFLNSWYWLAIIIITWSYDDVEEHYLNEFHIDNIEDSEPQEPDEMDSHLYEPDFFFFDIHSIKDYELLYYQYIDRFKKRYRF